jgi:chromosome segregation ATPase
MFRIFRKGESSEEKDVAMEAMKDREHETGDPLAVLEELERERNSLMEEKLGLLDIEDKLHHKIWEEIEDKKREIEELKNEISELKRRCEELVNILNMSVRR